METTLNVLVAAGGETDEELRALLKVHPSGCVLSRLPLGKAIADAAKKCYDLRIFLVPGALYATTEDVKIYLHASEKQAPAPDPSATWKPIPEPCLRVRIATLPQTAVGRTTLPGGRTYALAKLRTDKFLLFHGGLSVSLSRLDVEDLRLEVSGGDGAFSMERCSGTVVRVVVLKRSSQAIRACRLSSVGWPAATLDGTIGLGGTREAGDPVVSGCELRGLRVDVSRGRSMEVRGCRLIDTTWKFFLVGIDCGGCVRVVDNEVSNELRGGHQPYNLFRVDNCRVRVSNNRILQTVREADLEAFLSARVFVWRDVELNAHGRLRRSGPPPPSEAGKGCEDCRVAREDRFDFKTPFRGGHLFSLDRFGKIKASDNDFVLSVFPAVVGSGIWDDVFSSGGRNTWRVWKYAEPALKNAFFDAYAKAQASAREKGATRAHDPAAPTDEASCSAAQSAAASDVANQEPKTPTPFPRDAQPPNDAGSASPSSEPREEAKSSETHETLLEATDVTLAGFDPARWLEDHRRQPRTFGSIFDNMEKDADTMRLRATRIENKRELRRLLSLRYLGLVEPGIEFGVDPTDAFERSIGLPELDDADDCFLQSMRSVAHLECAVRREAKSDHKIVHEVGF